MKAQTLAWEGVRWTLVKWIHNPGTPLPCDGCGDPVEIRARFDAHDGTAAYWCADCVVTVRAYQEHSAEGVTL